MLFQMIQPDPSRVSFHREKKEVGSSCFEQNFLEGKFEFKVVAASPWLQVEAAHSPPPAPHPPPPASPAKRSFLFLLTYGSCHKWQRMRIPTLILNEVSLIHFHKVSHVQLFPGVMCLIADLDGFDFRALN